MPEPVDLALTVLDRQLIDSQGHRCGRVDEIEIDWQPGRPARVSHLLIGQAAAAGRLPRPLRSLVRRVAGDRIVRVRWSAVTQISHVVKLSETSVELGLADGERRASRWLARIPGA